MRIVFCLIFRVPKGHGSEASTNIKRKTLVNRTKNIAILGSTGSIGTQALEVIRKNPDHFSVSALTANNNAALLIDQAREFKPAVVAIASERLRSEVAAALEPLGIRVLSGFDALNEIVDQPGIDVVLSALVGFAGLLPTIRAVKNGINIALANKETLVVAGDLITASALNHGVTLYPVDSEHSAIFQCIVGEEENRIEKIFLTASGGPFRGRSRDQLKSVTHREALKHPNWSMGAKITIDSATLMNKGLEVIEAKWLFGLEPQQIDVVVHPQSIIHSMVQFEDGSVKAQMGLPDMRLPIQYALCHPERLPSDFPRYIPALQGSLTFEQPDTETFRNLALAFESLRKGGNQPCVLNAANEVAVQAFLEERIGFLDIPELIAKCLEKIAFTATPNIEDYVNTDAETRVYASELIKTKL